MALDRIGIVNLALDQAGLDSSFQTKARGWLNFVTQKLAEQYNYKFYRTTASDVPYIAGTKTYALPTSPAFQKADTVYRVNSDGSLGDQIFLMDSYRFDQYARGYTGDPTLALIDTKLNTITFNNTPASTTATSYRLTYFMKPAVLSTSNADDAVVPDFIDQNVLIQELMKMAYEHQDDERYQEKNQDALKANQMLQRNQFQATDTGLMDLSHSQFKPRRRR